MSGPKDARARYKRTQELFLKARRLEQPQRGEFLSKACGTDHDLRKELELLLKHDAQGVQLADDKTSDLRRGLEELHARASSSEETELPKTIGEYRIEKTLGEGGMGTVYQARQESLQRTVALKVLSHGLLSAQASRRFEHEGEFLARLEHPGIARIYDSGQAETAYGVQPYFAMELVHGAPLTDYARDRRLSAEERLELLARVADAVQHAHRQGVIHRDLKPDNILVTDSGQPKILDFGVARASDSDVQLTTMSTDVGQILGTLAYMSPEQASGDPKLIDARSDVYSLGVLLYELLAGVLPYDVSRRSLPDALRVIQEEEPRRLSTVHTVHRGDVETIVATALEKERLRRYATAAALAEDIRHFLKDEPIQARPASRVYTLQKFVRRHKTVVVATLLIVLSLAAGLVAALNFGLEEAQRRREVVRLSALQDVEDIVAEADSLWPLHPNLIGKYTEWTRRARGLLADNELHGYEVALEQVRERAEPRTLEEADSERRDHEKYWRLVETEGRIEWLKLQLRQRRDGVAAELPDLAELNLGELDLADAWEMTSLAWEYVHPGTVREFGKEPLGLALAYRAHELSSFEQRSDTAHILAWAYLSVGLVVEAEQTFQEAEAALDDMPLERRFLIERDEDSPLEGPRFFYRYLERMRTEAWIDRTEKRLEQLVSTVVELKVEVGERREWHFRDPVDRWWNNQLAKLIQELKSLESDLLDPEKSTTEHGWSMPHREQFALDLRTGFAPGGIYHRRWEEALPEISKDYAFRVTPQMGLVPIGRDPDSNFWAFAHLASGKPAPLTAEGRIEMRGDYGIVLLLLPGGEFWMGAQDTQPDARNYYEHASPYESPPHLVELSPFFISKFEMTQGQWLWLTGDNPSFDKKPQDLSHPVEMVDWDGCRTLCQRYGLALPTEAQWEYAARGGQSSTWWTGEDPRLLSSAENVADDTMRRTPGVGIDEFEEWSDGYSFKAPVGKLKPNDYGLYDVLGNVREWCQDTHLASVYLRPYSTDPVAETPLALMRVNRGGSLDKLAKYARCSKRHYVSAENRDIALGLRPARKFVPGKPRR